MSKARSSVRSSGRGAEAAASAERASSVKRLSVVPTLTGGSSPPKSDGSASASRAFTASLSLSYILWPPLTRAGRAHVRHAARFARQHLFEHLNRAADAQQRLAQLPRLIVQIRQALLPGLELLLQLVEPRL